MFVAGRSKAVAVVTDWRLSSDRDLDESDPGRAHALDFWRFGRFCFGKQWLSTTRVALFDHGAKPSLSHAAAQRGALAAWIEQHRPRRVYIIPTPDSTMGAEAVALKGSHCWAALHAPDTLEAMRGTRWAYNAHTEVTPVFPTARRVKELQRWCMAQWLRAHAMPTLELDEERLCIRPSLKMLNLMDSMVGRPLAVDLEFNPTTDIVTAIGLSDGQSAVSIPWDRYTPRNNEKEELGLNDYRFLSRDLVRVLRRLLSAHTAKIAHNFIADVPRLERKGFVINGPLHDTFAAHAIAFPELRHGLQHAAATLLPVPPWKSLYKPSRLARGITREDSEFWTADPKALRSYNCRDAFYTWHLCRAVLPHVGQTLT